MRIENEPAYVLGTRPYRETSLLIEAITPEHGRLALVARGVRGGRGQGARRAALEPFQRLRIGFSGRGEVLTLAAAESEGRALRPVGPPLFAALYVNELMQKLTARGDPVPALFARYADWLDELAALSALARTPAAGVAEAPAEPYRPAPAPASDEHALAWSLRRFERDLLALIGYALALDHDSEIGEPIRPDADYALDPEHGARRWRADLVWPRAKGATLLAWAADRPPDADTGRALKQLAREVIRHHLGGAELRAWHLAAEWRLRGP